MRSPRLAALLTLAALCLSLSSPASGAPTGAAPGRLALATPVLKWQRGGCYSSWCETGWYSSPAVADLDGDGRLEVVGSAYSIVALDGPTGALKWRVSSGHDRSQPGASDVGRTWPDVVVADVDADGSPEIVTAHSGGYVAVYDRNGYFKPGWPQHPAGEEFRSLAVADLDGDHKLEVIVASTRSDHQWYVYEPDGSLRPTYWPQHYPNSDANGYAAGAYNQNVAAADLDGDGRGEIVGPSDVHYITAYQDDGSQIRASAVYGHNSDGTNRYWGRVGVHVDNAVDLRGWANCGVEHRPNFANSAPIMVDLDGDGTLEVVVVGNVYNCGTDPYTDLYEMPFVFKADRTRWAAGPFDWTAIPVPDGHAAPLSEDYNLIENSLPNPVAADLDGDGRKEILYPSYDGRLHAYWLDKTEHGAWPYSVYNPAEGFYRFASEPVVADLDGDGKAEVIFASWPQKGGNRVGKLHILSYLGEPLQEIALPAPLGDDWNGGLAAPTLADVDGDGNLEVVLNTASSGLVAYTLPGTSGARILWGTGRASYQRAGAFVKGSVDGSTKTVWPARPRAGDVVTYTISLRNPGPALDGVSITDSLPAEVQYAGNLTASSGSANAAAGAVTWSGRVTAGQPVTISFDGRVDPGLTEPQAVSNVAAIDDGAGTVLRREAVVIVNGLGAYLPLIRQP